METPRGRIYPLQAIPEGQHRAMNGSSEPLKSQASRKAELERLRRELLRRIVQNEAQRRAAAVSAGRK